MTTKIDFEKAHKKFSSSKSAVELFYLRRFSICDLNSKRIIIASFFLIFPFLLSLLFYLLNFSDIMRILVTCVYILLVTVIGICIFSVWRKRKKIVENVIKYLNISKKEYYNLANSYYYDTYPDLERYIKYNSH
jgi:hypothetical protein